MTDKYGHVREVHTAIIVKISTFVDAYPEIH